jgi:hypothetical protein
MCALVATKISQIFKLAMEKLDQLVILDIQLLQDGLSWSEFNVE